MEAFIDGRELYVSLIGNGDALDVLPLTEMVFAKDKTRPEERIARRASFRQRAVDVAAYRVFA